MSHPYHKAVAEQFTPVSEPLPGQTTNNDGGGNWWAVNDWSMLDRFLILGTEGGTYYVAERKLTQDAAKSVIRCLDTDPMRAIKRTVEISESGRAAKNDPAIFVLALAASHPKSTVRSLVVEAVPRVCRIGTHIFQFVEMTHSLRGWGRSFRRMIQAWYHHKQKTGDLQLQVIKYRNRNGWTHSDLLRVSHTRPQTREEEQVFRWVRRGEVGSDCALIGAYEALQKATTAREACPLIEQFKLPWEAIPDALIKSPDVWSSLLQHMPYTATMRNLARLSAYGVLKPFSKDTKLVIERLTNSEQIRRSKVHPMGVLLALKTYAQGHGEKGSLKWEPVQQIVGALDSAFYEAFGNIPSTGKNFYLAIDVSASMGWSYCAGSPLLTAREGAAVMAMVTARREPNHLIMGFSHSLVPLKIHDKMRLDEVIKYMGGVPMGGTDCSAPILHATKEQYHVDAFGIYTDSETNSGKHPALALKEYRKKSGVRAKMYVCALQANHGSIADPNDAGMLDIVGFDANTPALISEFVG